MKKLNVEYPVGREDPKFHAAVESHPFDFAQGRL
jgi:hypothetical protein